jgi:hypothetical protein
MEVPSKPMLTADRNTPVVPVGFVAEPKYDGSPDTFACLTPHAPAWAALPISFGGARLPPHLRASPSRADLPPRDVWNG